MAEENREKEKPIRAKHATKRVLFAGVIVILIVLIGCFLWATNTLMSRSADKRLAAIEAARAIPAPENAAIIYNLLMESYDEGSFSTGFLDRETDSLTRRKPWLSKGYPELANWLKTHESTISALLQASKKKQCRFPINLGPQGMSNRMNRLTATRQWAFLLIRSANNDIAEGRIDTGLEKHLCLIQMAKHINQQPVMVDYLVGIAIEALASHGMARFIIEDNLTEKQLEIIEAVLPQTKNNWSKEWSTILEVERLYAKEVPSLLNRLSFWWLRSKKDTAVNNRTHKIYLRLLTDRRGKRILIALRRYKNKTAHWPQSLDQIKSSLSKEILTDPHNNGSFVYKLTDEGFKLYSKGPDNIDEDGRYKQGADDWPIWPAYGTKAENPRKNTNDE